MLIVNPDVVLADGAVAALTAAAERYPDAGLLAPRLVEPDGRVVFRSASVLGGDLRPGRPPERPEGDCCAPMLSGACLLVRRRAFLAIGGFDPAIFLFYEDDDLCRRMVAAGWSLVHVAGATAHHVRGGSSAPARGRVFTSRWHQAWSRAYVLAKHGRPTGALAFFLRNAGRALLAALALRPALVERYAGSAAGAFAWLRGRTALGREGLDGRP